MAASRAGARKPLGIKTSNVPTTSAYAKRAGLPAPSQARAGRASAKSQNARLQLERFATLWLVTPDEARKQQLVDGVPGPFKHVALAYESVSGEFDLPSQQHMFLEPRLLLSDEAAPAPMLTGMRRKLLRLETQC